MFYSSLCYVSIPITCCSHLLLLKALRSSEKPSFPSPDPCTCYALYSEPFSSFFSYLPLFFGSQFFYFLGGNPPNFCRFVGCFPSYALSSLSPRTYREGQLINFLSSQLELKLERHVQLPTPKIGPQILKNTC